MNIQEKATDAVPLNTRLRLGEALVRENLITGDQLSIVLKEQNKSYAPLGEICIKLGFISASRLRDLLAKILAHKSIDLGQVLPDTFAINLIPRELAHQLHIVPVGFDPSSNRLSIAMADIYNLRVLDRIRESLGENIKIIPLLAGDGEIAKAIEHFYGYQFSIKEILTEIEAGDPDITGLHMQGDEYTHPMVRLVDAILADAVRQGASDIHFEPEASYLRLRYRVDGVLRQELSLHRDYWPMIAVRLKVISKMDIAETRAPQDGHFSLQIHGHYIDFRASTLPVLHGENIVLRILDRDRGVLSLDTLKLPAKTLKTLKKIMARPEGIILLTGPTGSGKTTTLYSMLDYMKSEQVNIMTLEDPVEYPMDMIRQTSINEVLRMDFANGIRAILRQDPDIILVGEIRDEETAKMALRAAMTGHQVYTTLHSHSAIASLTRLNDVGIKNEMMAGNIIGIIGQRLVRILCPNCKQENKTSEMEMKLLNIDEAITVYRSKGCEACNDTGYKGRRAVMEVLDFDNGLEEMIFEKKTMARIRQYLNKKQFKTMADNGIDLIKAGVSSLEEVGRVISLTDKMQ